MALVSLSIINTIPWIVGLSEDGVLVPWAALFAGAAAATLLYQSGRSFVAGYQQGGGRDCFSYLRRKIHAM